MGSAESRPPYLFQWRDAFSSEKGPPPSARLLLWCISKHMELDGTSSFPGQQLLARETGLSLRTVKTRLGEAEQLGWLRRQPRVRNGVASFRYGTDYVPLIPARVLGGATVAPMSDGANRTTSGADRAASVQQLHPSTSRRSSEKVLAFKKRGFDPPAYNLGVGGESQQKWIEDYEEVQDRQERTGRVTIR